jgi:hypothetical protein
VNWASAAAISSRSRADHFETALDEVDTTGPLGDETVSAAEV